MTWLAQSELLADAIREPGSGATAVTASAWRAGVHPEATHGLVGAAVALIGNDALSSLWSPLPPCPDDATFLQQVTELEGAVADLLTWCRQLTRDCEDALASAQSRAAAASAAIAAAQAALAAAENSRAAAAAQAELAAAESTLSEALAQIADCECALEILGQVKDQLAYALKCLRQVPGDYAGHYEIPYQHRRRYGPLPAAGEFLTGTAA